MKNKHDNCLQIATKHVNNVTDILDRKRWHEYLVVRDTFQAALSLPLCDYLAQETAGYRCSIFHIIVQMTGHTIRHWVVDVLICIRIADVMRLVAYEIPI